MFINFAFVNSVDYTLPRSALSVPRRSRGVWLHPNGLRYEMYNIRRYVVIVMARLALARLA